LLAACSSRSCTGTMPCTKGLCMSQVQAAAVLLQLLRCVMCCAAHLSR
jgi:hypothetical protein